MKSMHAQIGRMPRKHVLLDSVCCSHKMSRVQIPVYSHTRYLGRLYGCAFVLSMSRYVKAIVLHIEAIVHAKLDRRVLGAPAPDVVEKKEFLNYVVRINTDDSAPNEAKRRAWVSDVKALHELCNGNRANPHNIEHFCKLQPDGRLCCTDADDCASKIVIAMLRVLCSRKVRRPTLREWSAVDFFSTFVVVGLHFHNILAEGYKMFLGTQQLDKSSKMPNVEDFGVRENDRVIALHRRAQNTLDFLSDPEAFVFCLSTSLVCRQSSWFIYKCLRETDPAKQIKPIDLVHPIYSKICQVQQE